MILAKKREDLLSIAFQGEPGAFGYEAAQVYFDDAMQGEQSYVPYRSFAAVFRAVAAGEVDYGIVPLENSQAGSITEVYDLLMQQQGLSVVGEIYHPVHQCLLCLPGQSLAEIKRVMSHPQALAQSEAFLSGLEVEIIATSNTAATAKMMRDERLRGVATVASASAAELYQLEILATNIQTVKENYTRFIALARFPAPSTMLSAKTMLMLETNHQPGALSACLGVLASRQINLLKLESRPSRQQLWEEVFFLDCEGNSNDPAFRAALDELAMHTRFCTVIGSFPDYTGKR